MLQTKHNMNSGVGLRLLIMPLAIILLLWVFGTQHSWAQETEKKEIADAKIMLALETELQLSEAVPSHLIDVFANEGIVTLSGSVSNVLAKERATELAETIKGVSAVVNNIEVNTILRPDEELKQDIINALLYDPATDSYEITPEVNQGAVTLEGTVESWQEKKLAGDVTRSVRGVMEVKNNIQIDYPERRADNEIEADIKRRLKNDVWVDEALINVNSEGGDVTLTGTVGSAAERRWAAYDAWVMGTESVDTSGLEIKWWARDEMKRKSAYEDVTDAEIEKAVQNAFVYDPRVNSFELQAEADNGVVTLSGTVDNYRAKMAAENDARNTIGVWRVKNHIKVRPGELPEDETLEDLVRAALARDPYVESYDIDITAVNGMVYLDGDVNTSYEKNHAAQVAWHVNGVVDIVNLIDYEHTWTHKNDWEIQQDVMNQLYWSPFVDLDDVHVTVENGVVILDGTVDTWIERTTAGRNAFEAGAKDVWNKIEVRYNGPYTLLPEEEE
jgi:osmotically-inducible protein OsmY